MTNSVWCAHLQLSWSRLALRSRPASRNGLSPGSFREGGTDAMPMDFVTDDASGPGRPTPVDRAYQKILTWTEEAAEGCAAALAPDVQEGSHESGPLCPCVDAASGAGADSRA